MSKTLKKLNKIFENVKHKNFGEIMEKVEPKN
jgi:hypothetical protein